MAGNNREQGHFAPGGLHNVYNGLAAVAVALECGLSLSEAVGCAGFADSRG